MGSKSTAAVRERRFVEEYLIDGNAGRAFLASYGGKKSASSVGGYKILKRPKVRALLDAARAKEADKYAATRERWVQEVTRIAFSDIGEIVDWDGAHIQIKAKADIPEAARRAIAEISETTTEQGGTIKVKLHDKLGALTALGKMLKLFVERHEIDVGPNLAEIIARAAELEDEQK